MTPKRPRRAAAAAATAALAAALSACGFEPKHAELSYSLNPSVLEENEDLALDAVAQAHLRGALEMLFGTPAAPGFMLTEELAGDGFDPNFGSAELTERQWEEVVLDNERRFARDLAAIEDGRFGDVRLPREAIGLREDWREVLAEWRELRAAVRAGSKDESALAAFEEGVKEDWPGWLAEYYPTLRESAELYRQQCLHCHGVEGGGDGPTAPYLNPRPRDYRPGTFKFTALADKKRPRREDLMRVLEEGIYTTAMPSFRRFSKAQLHGLVDYVRLLAIRGETEILISLDHDPYEGGIPFEAVAENYELVWDRWRGQADHVIAYEGEIPPATPERIAHGRELYMDPDGANCVKCHGSDARGKGPSAYEGVDPVTGEPLLAKDDWGEPIEPRDLTRGIYRFGRRPIDVYRRIYAGINGTPMPAHSTLMTPEGERLLSDEDMWDIVHYVRSLSSHPAPERFASAAERSAESGHEGTH